MRRNRRIILEGNHAVEYAIGYEDARDGLPQNSNDPWYSAGYADFLDGVHDQYEALHQDGITSPPNQQLQPVRENKMKITKRQLRKIIKEEKQRILKEALEQVDYDNPNQSWGANDQENREQFQGAMLDLDDYDDLRESLQEFANEYAHNSGYDPADIINAMKSIAGEL